MGESLVRTPHSETTATYEALATQNVDQDDLGRLRRGTGASFRVAILGQQLGIEHASFMTPLTGFRLEITLESRWDKVDRALIETAKKLHHSTISCKHGVGFGSFMEVLDKCHEFYGYEFLIWQAVCETMYQLAVNSLQPLPETAEMIRRLIASMEELPEYRIGCHRFKDMLPPDYRASLTLRKVLKLDDELKQESELMIAFWGATRMRTLQLIINRFLYWTV